MRIQGHLHSIEQATASIVLKPAAGLKGAYGPVAKLFHYDTHTNNYMLKFYSILLATTFTTALYYYLPGLYYWTQLVYYYMLLLCTTTITLHFTTTYDYS